MRKCGDTRIVYFFSLFALLRRSVVVAVVVFFVVVFLFFLIPVKIIRSGKVKMQGSFIRARVVLTFVYAGFHRSPRMRAIFLREVTLQDK